MRFVFLFFLMVFAAQAGFAYEVMPPDSISRNEPAGYAEAQPIQSQIEPQAPGKIPSFWWSFVLSAAGAYTLYGLAVGPLSVLIVFFSSKRNKKEVRKSIWGWIAGTLVGIGIFVLFKLVLKS